MLFFIVYGINKEGQRFLDGYEVENQSEVYDILKSLGFIPLKVFMIPSSFHFLSDLFRPSISKIEVIEILDDLNMTLNAGISLSDGLIDISEDSNNMNIKNIIVRILISVRSGKSLAYSFGKYEKFFTPTIINLISIGEETGKIATTLGDGADFLKRAEELRKNLKEALIYPFISITLMFVAIIAWMTLVVPQLIGFFEEVDSELPALTLFLIDTSKFFTEHIWSIFIFIIFFVLIFRFSYKKFKSFRVLVLKFILKIPVFSDIVRFYNISYIMDYLRLGLSSGITLYESLQILQNSVENDLYMSSIKNSILNIEKGESFSSTLKNNDLFTKFSVRVIRIGEYTGSMEHEFELLADLYYKKVNNLSKIIPRIFQTGALLIGGILMGLIIVGLMGPIYDLIGQL